MNFHTLYSNIIALRLKGVKMVNGGCEVFWRLTKMANRGCHSPDLFPP